MANSAAKADEGETDMSMEDILQSIRQIIAEEDTAAPGVDAPKSQQEEALAFGSDVLELTEVVDDDSSGAEPVDILKQIDEATATPAPVATEAPQAYEPEASEPFEPMAEAAPANRLLSKAVADASAASLKRIIETHKATSPMPHFRTGSTLEDLVLETLKPVLKEWLDANLPSMVERIVEREIRKLVD